MRISPETCGWDAAACSRDRSPPPRPRPPPAPGCRRRSTPRTPPQARPKARCPTSSSSGATTSAGSTSAPTTWGSWATARPNIDRIGREGAVFTDWYGQNSCTAGRAAFITGQSPIRTGLTKVGLPGAELGLKPEDPTIAELLKPLGYTTGQFGKNHLGDRNEHLPTAHGFDEFFGNLYHLNAEEEPEDPDYPKDPAFVANFGPRGVIHSWATEEEDATDDPKFGPVGKQRIEDTGALTIARMETVDTEITDAAETFIRNAVDAGTPFFVWWNSTRMHIWTHLKPESQGVTGLGIYPDGMVEHDADVGPPARPARRAGRDRQHHRHVLHRQRRRGDDLAGWRHDPVPRREGDHLRGRLPCALPLPLAGGDRAGHDQQ